MLYPSLLRNLLMRLATANLCQLHWFDDVQREWQRHVTARYGASPSALQRTQALMDEALPGARVSGYEHRLVSLSLPDADDRHVLAAALEAGASEILTFNLKDFPPERLASTPVRAVHPDEWLTQLFRQYPDEFTQVVWRLIDSLKNPPLTLSDLVERVRQLQLPQLAEALSPLERTP